MKKYLHIQKPWGKDRLVFGIQVALEKGFSPVIFVSAGFWLVGIGTNVTTKDDATN